jgi:LmbE family N-acetylglucosaminyl deacetylase
MLAETLRLLVIGAHPDDAEFRAGGLAALYRQLGHAVKFVSVTNGDAGHHAMGGVELARRRRAEATAAGRVCSVSYEVWDNHDGELEATLVLRKQVIRLVRSFRPDLVLTHRPNDYHPDHRHTSQLVQDAAYLVTVPNICSDTPHLEHDPVIMYLADDFEKPYPFTPSLVVDVDAVFAPKLAMLDCHVSQMYEWLPYNSGRSGDVPAEAAERRAWLARWLEEKGPPAARYRTLLARLYGPERAAGIRHIEAFEPCEYGRPMDTRLAATLFNFVPAFAAGDDGREPGLLTEGP